MSCHRVILLGKALSRFVGCLSLFLALGVTLASAQSTSTGTLFGIVTDPTGAAVVGATVTITDTATNIPRTVTSNESGRYRHMAAVAMPELVLRLVERPAAGQYGPSPSSWSSSTCPHGDGPLSKLKNSAARRCSTCGRAAGQAPRHRLPDRARPGGRRAGRGRGRPSWATWCACRAGPTSSTRWRPSSG